MSSPAVAGIVALMLEADPSLTPAEIQTILEETAREDNNTGELPEEGDLVWGHGKVTATAALQAVLGLNAVPKSPSTPALFHLFPNPARDVVEVQGMGTEPVRWTLLDLQGRSVDRGQGTLPLTIPLQRAADGLHLLHLKQGEHVVLIFLARFLQTTHFAFQLASLALGIGGVRAVSMLTEPFPYEADQQARNNPTKDHEEERQFNLQGDAREKRHFLWQKRQRYRLPIGKRNSHQTQCKHREESILEISHGPARLTVVQTIS